MKIIRKAGDTSNILQIFIQDSSSTTGAGLTGLAFGTAGLTAYYHKDTDTTATAITLVTMTVGTFTSSGFKEIDATNMPGWYQFCPPDAAFSTSGTPKSVGFHLKGATNMAPLAIEVQLVTFDLQTAALTAAAIATGVWQDTTAGDFTVASSIGKSVMNGVSLGTGLTVNALTTNNDKTGYSLTQAFPTNFSSLGISAGGHISNVDTLTTYTGNTVQTGDAYARLGAPAGASVSADVAAVKTDTGNIVTTTNKFAFTVANKVDANVLNINGSATAAANLALSAADMGRGTAGAAGTTTSITTSAFSPGGAGIVSGQFIGRTIIFDGNTATAALQGQATNITANTSGSTPTFTVTALTTAPSSGDTFSVV